MTDAPEPIRTVTFTSLFPNSEHKIHGIFVENRLRHLVASGQVTTTVVAPVQWFPSRAAMFGRYATYARVPAVERRHGLDIVHPRYLQVPRFGFHVSPPLMALAALPAVARACEAGRIDLIDAHYFYPDGVAAAMIGRRLGVPVVITARGTDVSLLPSFALPRRQILWAADQAAAMITVCAALKETLVDLGVAPERVTVLRNGVDLEGFRPRDRAAARARLGLTRRTLLSVGHLVERKGHHLVIEALASLPDTDLLIAGDGEMRAELTRLADQLGLGARVRFLGMLPHAELPGIYEAADALVLASSREGWANVLLEAMACGTPVVATNIWGTPEVVADPAAGVLAEARSAAGIAEGVTRLFASLPARAATRLYAERFSWDDTTAGQLRLFRAVIADHRRRAAVAAGAVR